MPSNPISTVGPSARWRARRHVAVAIGALLTLAAGTVVVPVARGSAPADCPWVTSTAPVETKVDMVLSQMTLHEKVGMVHGITAPAQFIGVQGGAPPYVGVVPAVTRLCIPSLKLEDGPAGVGDSMTGVTQLPAPVAAAATWDTDLMNRYGAVLGAEQWGKGANVVLAPTVNIVRDPRWGRAFEAFSEDPHLSASMGVAEINGIQAQGPMAQVKHVAAYNEETFRDTPLNNAIVDPRVLHEIYLRSFQAAVDQAHVSSVMCAYNQLNGVRDCENPYLMSQVLKGEFGFDGFVTSDWFATTSSAKSVNAGLDLQMPDDCLLGTQLEPEVQRGEVATSRLDDMVRRILRQMFVFDLFNRAQTGTPGTVVTNADHAAVARTTAEDGTVLLKNGGGLLPLDPARHQTVAVIGPSAGPTARSAGGGSAKVLPPYVVTPLDGISHRATGTNTAIRYNDGNNLLAAAATARAANVAVVFVNLFEEEDRDLATIDLPATQNALVATVAAANPNTVVVLNTGSAVFLPWLNQVKGVLEAWYPGQEDGNAIAHVLFGDVNPSGKLPVTFPATQAQMPTSRPDRWPGIAGQVQYSEGLDVGYRWYDDNKVAPAFPFGFGLSYTSFRYSNLRVGAPTTTDGTETVQVDVTNTGTRAGADVAQLYLTQPAASGEPPRQLQAFQKVSLDPGQTTTVTLHLDRTALSFWDPGLRQWKAMAGTYQLAVGDSSRTLPLTAGFALTQPLIFGTPTPPPPSTTAESPTNTVGDLTTCWQDQVGTLANGGLSLTGSPSTNLSDYPVG